MAVTKNNPSDISPQGDVSAPDEMSRSSQLAHDLGNFLNGIRLLAVSLRRNIPDGSPAQDDLQVLDAATSQAAEICRQLQAGNSPTGDPQPLDLNALISEMSRLLRIMTPAGVDLETELAAEIPPIEADAVELRQVVLDLFTNATDALDRGGQIVIRTGLVDLSRDDASQSQQEGSARCSTPHQCVYLEIEDNGCGMDEETLRQVFDPGFSTKTAGHGLGMGSVLRNVDGFGGAVTIDSRPGAGTTVRCMIPCAQEMQSESPVDSRRGEKGAALPAGGQAARVLLIEDHEASRNGSVMLLETCEEFDCQVHPCATGQQAIAAAHEHGPGLGLIILDIHLPDISGPELLSRLRRIAPETPVLAVSGLAPEEGAAQFNGSPPERLLTKPFAPDALLTAAAELLRAPRPA